jgi:hypothetical protein
LLCKLNRSNPYRRFADIPNRPPAINPYKRHRFPAEIISHCVWLYFRFCLSCRDIQELMAARGVIRPYEAVRYWCVKCGQPYANQLRQRWPSRIAAPRGPSIRPWVSWSTRRICGPTNLIQGQRCRGPSRRAGRCREGFIKRQGGVTRQDHRARSAITPVYTTPRRRVRLPSPGVDKWS